MQFDLISNQENVPRDACHFGCYGEFSYFVETTARCLKIDLCQEQHWSSGICWQSMTRLLKFPSFVFLLRSSIILCLRLFPSSQNSNNAPLRTFYLSSILYVLNLTTCREFSSINLHSRKLNFRSIQRLGDSMSFPIANALTATTPKVGY